MTTITHEKIERILAEHAKLILTPWHQDNLVSALRRAGERIREMEQDGERLDWLEKAAEHSISLFRNAGHNFTAYINDPATDNDFAQGTGDTVRAAIDAARRGEGAGE